MKAESRRVERHLAAAALDQQNLKQIAMAMRADGPVVDRRARGNGFNVNEIERLIVRRIAVQMKQRQRGGHDGSIGRSRAQKKEPRANAMRDVHKKAAARRAAGCRLPKQKVSGWAAASAGRLGRACSGRPAAAGRAYSAHPAAAGRACSGRPVCGFCGLFCSFAIGTFSVILRGLLSDRPPPNANNTLKGTRGSSRRLRQFMSNGLKSMGEFVSIAVAIRQLELPAGLTPAYRPGRDRPAPDRSARAAPLRPRRRRHCATPPP